MSRMLSPRLRPSDSPLRYGGQPRPTGNVVSLGIHAHGQLVIILSGELDLATAPERRRAFLGETGSYLIRLRYSCACSSAPPRQAARCA
jgi:hypothetical protein